MIKNIIFLLLFSVIKIESSIQIKNDSENIRNSSVTVYEKRLCGKGRQIEIVSDISYVFADKRYIIEFNIDDTHFEYTTNKNFNYIFSIKDDGIYLDDSWCNDLNGDEGLILSSKPTKIFEYNHN